MFKIGESIRNNHERIFNSVNDCSSYGLGALSTTESITEPITETSLKNESNNDEYAEKLESNGNFKHKNEETTFFIGPRLY